MSSIALQASLGLLPAWHSIDWAGGYRRVRSLQCEAAKLKASGNKAKCLLKAEADSVKPGTSPNTTRCLAAFEAAFAAAERNAGPGVCPTEGEVNAIETLVDACRDDVAAALSGSPPPACQKFPATGQKTCWNNAGTVISCAGTGQDGDIQAGKMLSYTDNGDGTITDNNTGLVWEKKSDDEAVNDNTTFPHDKDNHCSWNEAFDVHVHTLNNICKNDETVTCSANADCAAAGVSDGCGFAGKRDWRIPNVKELQSIIDYECFNPSVNTVFHTSCAPGDDVLTGSCTSESDFYWSSTTIAGGPDNAWDVDFGSGGVVGDGKDIHHPVHAVRGGLDDD